MMVYKLENLHLHSDRQLREDSSQISTGCVCLLSSTQLDVMWRNIVSVLLLGHASLLRLGTVSSWKLTWNRMVIQFLHFLLAQNFLLFFLIRCLQVQSTRMFAKETLFSYPVHPVPESRHSIQLLLLPLRRRSRSGERPSSSSVDTGLSLGSACVCHALCCCNFLLTVTQLCCPDWAGTRSESPHSTQ